MVIEALALLLAAAADPGATTAPARAEPAEVVIDRSRQIDFVSRITGRPYRLQIAFPETPPPPGGYPVFYIIDGGLYFGTATEAMRLQGRHFITPAIVVGIGYQASGTTAALLQRNKDLTPPISAARLSEKLFSLNGFKSPEDTGGLDLYLRMVREEVRETVATLAPIDRSRQVLFGHSLGGRAVIRQLLTDPSAYQGYVASSPSLWLDTDALLADVDGLPQKLTAAKVRPKLLIDAGGLEDRAPRLPPGYPMSNAEAEALARALGMVSKVEALGARLSQMGGIDTRTVVFPDEDHASVIPAALSRGLRVTLGR